MSRRLFEATHEVAARLTRSPHVLLCLDFDGTLCPIADRPELASLSAETRQALATLTRYRGATVAILSGRGESNLEQLVGLPNVIYSGNHGLEIRGPGVSFVEPTAAACRDELSSLAARLRRQLENIEGALVEDKELTLTVHFRLVAPERQESVRRIVHQLLADSDHRFVLTAGKKVLEIRPPVHWNKGTALRWLQRRLGKPNSLVVYVGDDVTDEDAFAQLPDDVTVKVGGGAATGAHFFVDNPAEVRLFLQWLAERMRPKQPE